ncbi:DUF4190 domain-containing protein [Heyndrickxia shackletonii]|nr:DUF4190 domain-containing protein [Heyndrickxia shackletonii]MBB2480118.1 DUF4190 domain-containing protein [Bacillus sp. APMAM]
MKEDTRYDKLDNEVHDVEDDHDIHDAEDLDNMYGARKVDDNHHDFDEEAAAEIATPVQMNRYERYEDREDNDRNDVDTGGRAIGWAALALSIISLFVLPVILGAAAVVLGFVARHKGAGTLGAWSIGIGVVSIIIGIFVLPFF